MKAPIIPCRSDWVTVKEKNGKKRKKRRHTVTAYRSGDRYQCVYCGKIDVVSSFIYGVESDRASNIRSNESFTKWDRMADPFRDLAERFPKHTVIYEWEDAVAKHMSVFISEKTIDEGGKPLSNKKFQKLLRDSASELTPPAVWIVLGCLSCWKTSEIIKLPESHRKAKTDLGKMNHAYRKWVTNYYKRWHKMEDIIQVKIKDKTVS